MCAVFFCECFLESLLEINKRMNAPFKRTVLLPAGTSLMLLCGSAASCHAPSTSCHLHTWHAGMTFTSSHVGIIRNQSNVQLERKNFVEACKIS